MGLKGHLSLSGTADVGIALPPGWAAGPLVSLVCYYQTMDMLAKDILLLQGHSKIGGNDEDNHRNKHPTPEVGVVVGCIL